MAVTFRNIADLKRNPVERKAKTIKFPSGFPVPMGKQMSQGAPKLLRKLKFPKPDKAVK